MSTQTEYRSLRKFSIGNPAIDIPKDAFLLYDGYTLTLSGRPPVALPSLRGAITSGWIVEASQYREGMKAPRPVSANISMRPADGGNPSDQTRRVATMTVQAEEQEVGRIRSHAQYVQDVNSGNTSVEMQDGVPVRYVGKPAQQGDRVELTGTNAHRLIETSKARPVQPGVGRTREDVLASLSPEQKALYEAQIEARKVSHPGHDREEPGVTVLRGPETQGQVVARVVSSETVKAREGVQIGSSIGGGIETVDAGGTGGQTATRVVEREGMRFVETNGPRGEVPPRASPLETETDPRRIVAKSICSDFPDVYDFDASVKKKIARIQADFEDRPDIIKAIAAAETDPEMKQRIVTEFPSVFS